MISRRPKYVPIRPRRFASTIVIGWGLMDQGISSVTNLGVSVLIAKLDSRAGFGAYSLAFVGYTLATGIAINLGTVPAMIRDRPDKEAQQQSLDRAVSAGTCVGLVFSMALLPIGLLSHDPIRGYFILFGVLMPFLMLQALWRAACFAARDPRAATLCDGIWLAVQGVSSLVLALLGIRSALWYAASWGFGAAAGGVTFSIRARVWPRLTNLRAHLAEYRDLIPNLVGEFIAAAGVNQTLPYILVPIVALAGIAAIKAGNLELGLLNVPLQGLGPLAMAYAVRAFRQGQAELRKLLRVCVIGGGALILAYGVGVSLIPVSLLHHVVGPNAGSAQPLVIPLAIALLGNWTAYVAYMGLRARLDVRITFIIQIGISALLLAGVLVGAVTAGVVGACWGMAVAYCLGAATAWLFHFGRMRVG